MNGNLEMSNLTCSHCRHKGKDVIIRTGYVGGKGYETSLECRNRVECWKRYDRQHGLSNVYGVLDNGLTFCLTPEWVRGYEEDNENV